MSRGAGSPPTPRAPATRSVRWWDRAKGSCAQTTNRGWSGADRDHPLSGTGEHDVQRGPTSGGLRLDLVRSDDHDSVELEALGLQPGEHRDAGVTAAGRRLGQVRPGVEPALDLAPPRDGYDDADGSLEGVRELRDGRSNPLVQIEDPSLLRLDSGFPDGVREVDVEPDPLGVPRGEVVDLLAVAVVRREVELVARLVPERPLPGGGRLLRHRPGRLCGIADDGPGGGAAPAAHHPPL